jgi:putative SOS response-associated peptidase YedK
MCGRYSIAVEGEKLQRYSAARLTFPYVPRYNAAPSQDLPVILNESPEKIVAVRWGLKPPWIRSIKRDGLINVRSDTLKKERATFSKDLLERRCLVLADGFYEWKGTSSGRKIPYRFVRKDRSLLAFAGLWQMNRDKDGNDLRTFAIDDRRAYRVVTKHHVVR